jgi:uncharacterized protein YbjT (DUF2867 family)
MILVTQGTTAFGEALVRLLAARGQGVRVLVPDPEAAGSITGPLVDIVRGHAADKRTLDAALAGVDQVLLASSATLEGLDQRRRAIESVRRAGVRTVVHLSMLGADRSSPVEIAREHASVERQLQASGVDWVHLRPHLFMQTMRALLSTVGNDGRLFAPLGDARTAMIDSHDVAEAAAVCLLEPYHAGRSYELSGPDALGMRDVASLLSRALGRRIEYVDVEPEEAERRWIEGGMGEELAREAVALCRVTRLAANGQRRAAFDALCGRPPRSFGEYLEDQLPPPRRELEARPS